MKKFIAEILVVAVIVIAVVLSSCTVSSNDIAWEDSIANPVNSEFVVEVAFNLDIDVDSVTQEQFNARYSETFVVQP